MRRARKIIFQLDQFKVPSLFTGGKWKIEQPAIKAPPFKPRLEKGKFKF